MDGTQRTSVRVKSTIRFCESLTERGRSPTATQGWGLPSTPDTDSVQGRTFTRSPMYVVGTSAVDDEPYMLALFSQVASVAIAEASRTCDDECARVRSNVQVSASYTSRRSFHGRCVRGGDKRWLICMLATSVISFRLRRGGSTNVAVRSCGRAY
eukprot:461822-Pleurochrysis_carterae.AAC.1